MNTETNAGIVTLEDVLETLVGMEIVDELDTAEDMQDVARSRAERLGFSSAELGERTTHGH